VAENISIRLDPFLWGKSDSFSRTFYKMLVYGKPLNWDGISKLRQPLHGRMRPDKSSDRSELTEFCWTPRDDGIHFVCEELRRESESKFKPLVTYTPSMTPALGRLFILTVR
jgi:hypothetical protein